MNQRIAILHLEDNARDSELICSYLKSAGIEFDVDLVRDGPEFTDRLAKKEFDVILSDFRMPGFSGLDALRIAREVAPMTPFIFVSGTIGEELAVQSLTQGASDYILKHRPARLPSAVRRLVEEATMKRSQAANAAFQDFQSALLSNVSDALFAIDGSRHIAYWNDSASALFEAIGPHPTGQTIESVDRLCGCDFFRKLMAADLGPGESLDLLSEFNSGASKWISAKHSHGFDSPASQRLEVFVAIDISERKQFETRIVQMNQVLEQRVADRTADLTAINEELRAFAYSVSHDLQAPLRVMSAYSRVLLEDHATELGPEAKTFLDRISNACQRMDNLVVGLLHLATLAREQLDRQPVNLSELAETVANEIVGSHPDRKINVSVQPGLTVNADRRLMRSLFENLIGNAVKYSATRTEARIDIGQTERDGAMQFFVRDNGVGFPNEFATTIFQPFNRLHSGPEYSGHGIGLATAYRIVAKHGGAMTAEGQPGQGAVFYFFIP